MVGGTEPTADAEYGEFSIVVKKGTGVKIKKNIEIAEFLAAPVKCGDKVGKMIFTADGKTFGEVNITSVTEIQKISFGKLLERILYVFFMR